MMKKAKARHQSELVSGRVIPAASMRFLALSATIPNFEDIAQWCADWRFAFVCLQLLARFASAFVQLSA